MALLRRLALVALTVACAAALALVGRVAWMAHGPASDARRLDAHLAFLDAAIADGAPERMQGLFPGRTPP